MSLIDDLSSSMRWAVVNLNFTVVQGSRDACETKALLAKTVCCITVRGFVGFSCSIYHDMYISFSERLDNGDGS